MWIGMKDQITNGTVDISYVDETVRTVLRTKFALGLFESESSPASLSIPTPIALTRI